jgi:hypothetical protein
VPTASEDKGTEALREQWATELTHGRSLPSAEMPIMLVAIGFQMTGPVILSIVLPVLDALDISGTRPLGVSTLAIDLRQLESFAAIEQTWFIYAFSGQASSGLMTLSDTRRPKILIAMCKAINLASALLQS